MASTDEYQQVQFWKKRLFCEEFKDRVVYPVTPIRCVEKDKEGNCLMSMRWVIINLDKI